MEDEFDNLSRALSSSGTEKGRALAAQRLTLDEDFSLVSVKSRVKAEKGRALTADENARVEQLVKDLDSATKKAAELEAQLNDARADRTIRRHASGRRRPEAAREADITALAARTRELLKGGCR